MPTQTAPGAQGAVVSQASPGGTEPAVTQEVVLSSRGTHAWPGRQPDCGTTLQPPSGKHAPMPVGSPEAPAMGMHHRPAGHTPPAAAQQSARHALPGMPGAQKSPGAHSAPVVHGAASAPGTSTRALRVPSEPAPSTTT